MNALLAAVLVLAAVPWHSSPDAAVAAARAERKILLVHYRGSCGNCNDAADRTMESAAADPVFQQALGSFVPLRVTAAQPEAKRYDDLFLKNRQPVLAFFTSDGQLLHWIENPNRGWPAIAEEVLAMANARVPAAQASELRAAGDIPGADFTLAMALMATKRHNRAARRFDTAAEGYRAAKDQESEQLARVYAGFAWALAGEQGRGRTMIDRVRRKPASPAVAAEAHLLIGELYEIEARNIVPLPGEASHRRLFDDALKSYREAYDLAPAGSPLVDKARRAVARLDASPLPPKGIDRPTIGIVPPARATITDAAEFLAWASDRVVRVDFFLDEKKVATASETPFRAVLDVGSIPRVRVVKAIGYDAQGRAVGEAATTINDRLDAFLLNIISPVGPVLEGRVEAELDAKFAPGRKLAKLELSWNDTPVAVSDTPPYRATLEVKPGEFGYLRAAGTLDDGTTAEAVRVYNATGVSESVEVANVIVLASVTDDDGRRVANLQSSDFTIYDEEQRVAPVLRSSDDDPVTIGIAIDSSSSMRGRQIHMLRAAAELLATAMRPQDQAFVVSFDSAPRLVHGRSSDSASLRGALLQLLPAGGTSIFDGVTFALQQLQGLPGKKVLIVFSDGDEGKSGASPGESERLARSVGVPVYVVLPPDGVRFRNALNDIVGATGGLMLNVPPDAEELSATIAKLAEEIRGQYVLSFTRPPNVEPGSWRKIRLIVDRKNVRVRTIAGYRAW